MDRLTLQEIKVPSFPTCEPVFLTHIPGIPTTVNHSYGTSGKITKNGRRHYRTQKTMAWIDRVIYAVREEIQNRPTIFIPPLHVAFIFIGVTGDISNYIKVTEDALKVAIGIDDKYFHPLTIDKRSKNRGESKGAIIAIWNDQQTEERSPVPNRAIRKSVESSG
jgi:Holliday junction resolvase RusA-like endonuclease